MQSPPSLLLITVDCFRADHASFLGYPRPTTPFLDSLASESVVFSNAIVAGAPTYFSFPAIMASRHPLGLGRDVVGLAPQEPTMASALSDSGYATAAFLAANPYLSPRFGYDAGFGTFKDFLSADASPVPVGADAETSERLASRWNRRLAKVSHALGPVGALYDELYFQYGLQVGSSRGSSFDQLRRFPSADVMVDHARDWLTAIGGQPFFLWLHLMDPHSPYYPRQEGLELMGSSLNASRSRYLNAYWNRGDVEAARWRQHLEDIVALYDAGIRWVDAQVARLVETLRGLGRWQSCVMALTADHGEEFLEHGGRYHPPARVAEELVHVPLLLHGPGLPQAATVAAPFSLLHLAPTLLDLVDVPIPGSFRGNSHATRLKSGSVWESDAIIECIGGCTNPFVAESRFQPRVLAVREARYKMVLDFKSGVEQLFNLETDPGELRPLPPDAEKPVRRRLLERARQHLTDSLRSRDEDRRMAAQLRDLRLEWISPAIPTSV